MELVQYHSSACSRSQFLIIEFRQKLRITHELIIGKADFAQSREELFTDFTILPEIL